VSGDRTEEPTPRRLRQARERGQVPRSRLFTGSLVLAGGSAGAALGLGWAAEELRGWTATLLARGSSVPAALHQAQPRFKIHCAGENQSGVLPQAQARRPLTRQHNVGRLGP